MGDRRFAWFMCGLVVAVLLAALVDPARAQECADIGLLKAAISRTFSDRGRHRLARRAPDSPQG